MSSHQETPGAHSDSPDPASHSVNIYDTAEGEWIDEEDDDDMEYEPTTGDSEDIEFFETEEDEMDYHGTMQMEKAGLSMISLTGD